MVIEHLKEIFSDLVNLNRPVARLLQPGKSGDQLLREIMFTQLVMPADFYELYAWRNGTSVPQGTLLDDIHFFPGFYFLSSEDAVKNYFAMRNDARWNKSWFPIFANGGGDFYAIDVSKGKNRAIVGFMLGELDQALEYENLEAMLGTIAECYSTGTFFVTSDGWLEMDSSKHQAIARKHNPTISFR